MTIDEIKTLQNESGLDAIVEAYTEAAKQHEVVGKALDEIRETLENAGLL